MASPPRDSIFDNGVNHAASTRADFASGLPLYVVSTVIIIFGILLGMSVFRTPSGPSEAGADLRAVCDRYDGQHYKDIAVRGYEYDPRRRSDVAFFPLYPLLVRGVISFGAVPEVALLLVSNVLLAITFIVVHRYVRTGESDPASPVPVYTVAALAFFPPTIFFHMAYSESSFLCLAALTFLAIHRHSSDWLIAFLAGLTSATRPVGVALLPVVLLYLWRRSPNVASFALRASYLGPLSCWGLIAFMAYQDLSFGDALAFAKTQAHWSAYTHYDLSDKVTSLLTLEPIWGAYSPSSPRYWARMEHYHEPIYSLLFLNPIIFVAAAGTILAGAYMRLMNSYELVLAVGLLLIPYATRAYENSMFSMGRFSAAVLPCYFVWGRLATFLPRSIRTGCVALGSYFLGVFAAMYASGHLYF